MTDQAQKAHRYSRWVTEIDGGRPVRAYQEFADDIDGPWFGGYPKSYDPCICGHLRREHSDSGFECCSYIHCECVSFARAWDSAGTDQPTTNIDQIGSSDSEPLATVESREAEGQSHDERYQREVDAHGVTMEALRTAEGQAREYYQAVAIATEMMDQAKVPTVHPETGAPCSFTGRVSLLLSPDGPSADWKQVAFDMVEALTTDHVEMSLAGRVSLARQFFANAVDTEPVAECQHVFPTGSSVCSKCGRVLTVECAADDAGTECGFQWGLSVSHGIHRCTLIGAHKIHVCVTCSSSQTAADDVSHAHPRRRILWNEAERKTIDEFVVHDATIHLEQMDDNCYWIGITDADGREFSVNLHTPRATIRCTQQDCEWMWDEDATHEPHKPGGESVKAVGSAGDNT